MLMKFFILLASISHFQIIIEVLLMISIIPYTMPILIMYFAALNSPWRCAANSTMCTFPTNQTFDSSSSQYEARCSMKQSDWEFVQPKEFSIVTQVFLKSFFQTTTRVHFYHNTWVSFRNKLSQKSICCEIPGSNKIFVKRFL